MSVLEEELGLSNGDPGLYVFDKKTLEAAIKKGMRMSVLADDGLAVEEAALEESCRALQSDLWKVDLAWREQADAPAHAPPAGGGASARFQRKLATRDPRVGAGPPTPPKRNAPCFVGPTRRSGAP